MLPGMPNVPCEDGSGCLALAPCQVAARLGVSKSSIYEQIAAGRLPYVRLGSRRIVVEVCQLEEYLRLRRWSAEEAAARSSAEGDCSSERRQARETGR